MLVVYNKVDLYVSAGSFTGSDCVKGILLLKGKYQSADFHRFNFTLT